VGEGEVCTEKPRRLPEQVRDWLDSQDVQEAVDRLLQ
jgi:hypothetical protein